jgi:hypothetical protein
MLARLTAEQLIAQITRTEAASASNAYLLGSYLQELSQPKRYKDELGFGTFEELLEKRELPSRVTAFKLIKVVGTFSDAEVQQLGGMEKSYTLIRYAKRQGAGADPRKFLAPNARVGGNSVSKISIRALNGIMRAMTPGNANDTDAAAANDAAHKAATKASNALGRALKRAGLKHRMRVHAHGTECVSAHFDSATATQLAALLRKLKKLEKPTK